DMVEKLFRYDVADTLRRSTTARVMPVILKIIAVIESDFLSCADVPAGDNPDMVPFPPNLAIRLTTMVDETSQIIFHRAVNVLARAKGEDVEVAGNASAQHLVAV